MLDHLRRCGGLVQRTKRRDIEERLDFGALQNARRNHFAAFQQLRSGLCAQERVQVRGTRGCHQPQDAPVHRQEAAGRISKRGSHVGGSRAAHRGLGLWGVQSLVSLFLVLNQVVNFRR